MSRYTVTTFDLCVQGFERLRSRTEFILTAYPGPTDSPENLQQEWLADIQAFMRDDDFDYDAANAAVKAFVEANYEPLTAQLGAVEWPPEDEAEDDGNPLTAFLYVNDNEAD